MTDLTPTERPRVLVTSDDFERADHLVGEDEYATAWFDNARKRADALLDEPPKSYDIPDGVRLLVTCRRVKERVRVLAALYRLTGEERYVERLWTELDAVTDYPDWNPDHFLDVAEMTTAVAIGYDWCYEYWSESQRAQLRDAMVEHGFSEVLPGYRNEVEGARDNHPTWWIGCHHNWSTVCNGGMTIGAIALLGEADLDPRLETVIESARGLIEKPIAALAPNGGWPEGLGYFRYNAEYLSYYLASLDSALDTDFGYLSYPGMDSIGDFPIHATAPNGTPFHFGDSEGDSRIDSPALLWFARQFDRPTWGGYQRRSVGDDGGIQDLLWYDPDYVADPESADLPLDAYFPGAEESVTMRGAWGDPDAPFVGLKGGDNQVNHGDLDLGSVTVDVGGVRWAVDLGPSDYNVPGYWDMGADGDRWQYYRKRAEGHNVPVFDAGEGPDQHPFATASVECVRTHRDSAFAIADLSAAYDSAPLRRGVALVDDRSTVVLQDEITADETIDGWWFMHTRADVSTRGQSATLTEGGEELSVRITSPADAAFEVMDAAPLPDSPHPEAEEPVEGVRKLAIPLDDVETATVSVRAGEDLPASGDEAVPLAEWSRSSISSSEP